MVKLLSYFLKIPHYYVKVNMQKHNTEACFFFSFSRMLVIHFRTLKHFEIT